MLENTSHVTEPDVASLNGLEREGITLEKAAVPWSAKSSEGRSRNTVLDKGLSGVEEAAAGSGVDGNKSAVAQLQETTEKAFAGYLAAATGVPGNPTGVQLWAGAYQNDPLGAILSAKYPALKYVNGGYYGAYSGVGTLNQNGTPPALLNGIRLGVIGADRPMTTSKSKSKKAKRKSANRKSSTART